jgi:hypothetical protein
MTQVMDSEQTLQGGKETKSDSEDDTCFGFVWEKIVDKHTDVIDGVVIEAERVAASDKKDVVLIPEHWECPFRHLIVPESEEQKQTEDSEEDNVPVSQIMAQDKLKNKGKEEAKVGEELIGTRVAKTNRAGIVYR